MSLHNDIINLPCKDWGEKDCSAYRYGHRDARHAAAEFANAVDAKLEDIRTFLEGWMYEGSLQTFESREKFRKECAAMLDSLK